MNSTKKVLEGLHPLLKKEFSCNGANFFMQVFKPSNNESQINKIKF